MPTERRVRRLLKATAAGVEREAYAAGHADGLRAGTDAAVRLVKAAGWEEGKHPRDHGQFSSGPGSPDDSVPAAAGREPDPVADAGTSDPAADGYDGCVLVPLLGNSGDAVRAFAAKIDPADVIELEPTPHVTVRYGLDATPEQVAAALADFGPVEFVVAGLGMFAHGEQDVLYFNVAKCDGLFRLRAVLAALPHRDTHPGYLAHATVAYLKPGTAHKYLNHVTDPEGYSVGAGEAVYHPPGKGDPVRIPLAGQTVKALPTDDDARELLHAAMLAVAERHAGAGAGTDPAAELLKAVDAAGHKHRGEGPGGGQFADGDGSGGPTEKPQKTAKIPAHDAVNGGHTPENIGPARVPPKQLAALRRKAAEKLAAAPSPAAEDVARNNAKIDELGAAQFEANERGNSKTRAASRSRLAAEWGDGKTCGCVYCGLVIHADPPTPDRVISRDKLYTAREGGKYRAENLLPACLACNQARGDKPFAEFMAKMGGGE